MHDFTIETFLVKFYKYIHRINYEIMYESKIIISQLQEMKKFYLFFDILLDICFPLFKILVIGEICHKSKILELENTSLFIGMGKKGPDKLNVCLFF